MNINIPKKLNMEKNIGYLILSNPPLSLNHPKKKNDVITPIK